MRTSFLNSITALSAALVLSACIDNDYDAPDYVALPNGATVTVSDIYDMHAKKQASFVITDTAYLYATVIGDESSGNLYKQLYVQDETGGINLQLEASAANVRIGDYVKIVLNGLSVSKYNELMQLGGIDPAYDIIVQRNECYIEPEVVTIKQLNNSDFAYTCKLVRLENVQFAASDTAGTYADGYAQTSKNLTLTDSLGNEVIVRNSGYANFANKKVIGGRGNATFIVSRYSSTVQLLIRNVNELELTGARFVSGQEKDAVFSQTFDSNFGSFTTFSVSGEQTWAISYSTATMTGYANSTNYDNEDWLISPEIDLTNETAAGFSMSYIARYFSDINSDITLQVSTDYKTGKSPTNATWTAVQATWTEGSDWNTFATTNLDISAYAGKKITVAIKYISTSKKAGTLEIKSISITNKVENNTNPGNNTSAGTFEAPLSVSDAATATGTKWVKAYIVGVYETKDASGATLEKYAMSTKAPFYTATNLLIAASATETDLSKCLTVQLPTGDIRAALNLVDNASNLGKEVMIYGSLEKYFNMPGVKSLTGYWLDGNGIKPDNGGGTNNGNTNAIFAEAFDKSQGQFVIHDVDKGELSYVWNFDKKYTCMKASAYYNSKQNESDSWLVSPAITLGSGTNKLSFQQAANYVAQPKDALHVMISTDFDGDVASADWTELNDDISTWPTGSDFKFVTSTADLSAFAGKTIHVAFQYTSTDSEAATWEIKDFKIE